MILLFVASVNLYAADKKKRTRLPQEAESYFDKNAKSRKRDADKQVKHDSSEDIRGKRDYMGKVRVQERAISAWLLKQYKKSEYNIDDYAGE